MRGAGIPIFIVVDVYHINAATITHIEETPEGTLIINLLNEREIYLPALAKAQLLQELQRVAALAGVTS